MIARSSIVNARSLHLVGEGTLEPVGERVGAGRTDEDGEVLHGVRCDGKARQHHRTSLLSCEQPSIPLKIGGRRCLCSQDGLRDQT